MRNPISPVAPGAVKPVQSKPDAPAREGVHGSRSFAELLAEAEAVRDRIEISGQRAGPASLPGALQSAAAFVVRQAPWMGLPLLLRQSSAGETTDERPPERRRRKV